MFDMYILLNNGELHKSDIHFHSDFAAYSQLDQWACVCKAKTGYVVDNSTGEIVRTWMPW